MELRSIDTAKDATIDLELRSFDTAKDATIDVSLRSIDTAKDATIDVSLRSIDTAKDATIDVSLRSIDTAKDATIDLMTLNKKIVNLRATVKRSKAHVINKLTRNIASLKKKKGSDEEKAKNLQKAQRYFDEIKSMRSLKDDKITKYSIANVSTFEQISKTTLSSGARALARLADHHIMKEAVKKFREEHSDWRDLAAFMLIQQTGRKFKSQKKNKDKKSVAENINASKLMTTAYTQGLFREDTFPKVEEKSEEKRKKNNEKKKVLNKNNEVGQNFSEKEKPSELVCNDNVEVERGEVSVVEGMHKSVVSGGTKMLENQNEANSTTERNEANSTTERSKQEIGQSKLVNETKRRGKFIPKNISKDTSTINQNVDRSLNTIDSNKQIDDGESSEGEEDIDGESSEGEDVGGESSKGEEDVDGESSEEEDEEEEMKECEDDVNSDNLSDDENATDNESENKETSEEEFSPSFAETVEKPKQPQEPPIKKMPSGKNKECVVKQLNIESENSDSDDEEISSDSDDVEEGKSDEEVDSNDDNESEKNEEEESKTSKRRLKKKDKTLPDFLTKRDDSSRKLPRDPFFEGSDLEDDGYDYDYEEDGVVGDEVEDDDTDIQEKFKGNKKMTKSLFYKPGDERKSFERKDLSSDRGRGRGRGRDGMNSRGGFQDRTRGGFQDRTRGGFQDRTRGGFQDRIRGGFQDRTRGGFQDRTRGGFDRRGRGSFGESRGRGSHTFGSNNKGRSTVSSTSQADSSVTPKPAEKLHPSWEASRKRKAEQAGIKAFAGTKITFNDDD